MYYLIFYCIILVTRTDAAAPLVAAAKGAALVAQDAAPLPPHGKY